MGSIPVRLRLVSSPAMPKTLAAVCAFFLILVGSACGRGGADFVFRGGGVYTLDGDRPWAESVVVDGGRIVAVGPDDETARYIGRGTEVVDLLDHKYINDIMENPTAEVMAVWIWKRLCRPLQGLVEIELHETRNCSVIYRGE